MKKLITLIVTVALGITIYARMSDSKKRFCRELFRQVPWLIPRYFV